MPPYLQFVYNAEIPRATNGLITREMLKGESFFNVKYSRRNLLIVEGKKNEDNGKSSKAIASS